MSVRNVCSLPPIVEALSKRIDVLAKMHTYPSSVAVSNDPTTSGGGVLHLVRLFNLDQLAITSR